VSFRTLTEKGLPGRVFAQTLNGLEFRLNRRFPVHRYAGHDFIPGIIVTGFT